jgi:hypothetical protein
LWENQKGSLDSLRVNSVKQWLARWLSLLRCLRSAVTSACSSSGIGCVQGDIKIQEGGEANKGALLTWYNGARGSVCDGITGVNNAGGASNGYVNRGGGRKVATTTCRELGYKWGKEFNANAGGEVAVVVDGTSNLRITSKAARV